MTDQLMMISRTSFHSQRPLNDSDLTDTTLLIKCLLVMSRHFDNIATIANYEYISSIVAIAINIIIAVS